jgi:hypothetical protein
VATARQLSRTFALANCVLAGLAAVLASFGLGGNLLDGNVARLGLALACFCAGVALLAVGSGGLVGLALVAIAVDRGAAVAASAAAATAVVVVATAVLEGWGICVASATALVACAFGFLVYRGREHL